MSLVENTAKAISFSVGQTFISKALAAIQFAILIRLLSTMDMGAIGLAGGYLSMLGLFMLLPESVFVRDFPRIKEKIHEYISAFTAFGFYRSIVFMIVAGLIAFFLAGTQNYAQLGIYFLLATLATCISAFAGPFREAFYANFRQGRIALVDLGTNFVQLLLIALVWQHPTLITYGLVLVAGACVTAVWWYVTAKTQMQFAFHLPKNWKKLVMDSVKDFSLWNQLSSMLVRVLYQADVIILGFFVSLSALGDYTIALTIANVFFVVPQLFQKTFSVSFSRLEEKSRLAHGLGLAVKYNALFSIAQLVGYLVLQPWIMAFFGPEHPETVSLYAFFIITGVTLFNLARPWVGLTTVKESAKKLFQELYIAQGVAAIVIYAIAASYFGVVGVAMANIVVFGFASLLTIVHATRTLRIWPELHVWTSYESDYLKKFVSRAKNK